MSDLCCSRRLLGCRRHSRHMASTHLQPSLVRWRGRNHRVVPSLIYAYITRKRHQQRGCLSGHLCAVQHHQSWTNQTRRSERHLQQKTTSHRTIPLRSIETCRRSLGDSNESTQSSAYLTFEQLSIWLQCWAAAAATEPWVNCPWNSGSSRCPYAQDGGQQRRW